MRRHILRQLAFLAASMASLLALQSGCQPGPPVTSSGPSVTSWNCPRMLEVKQEWQALHDSFGDKWTKDNYGEHTSKLQGIFKKRLSPQDMAVLAATVTAAHENTWSEFDRSAMEVLFEAFVTSGDRENLVTLLASRCASEYSFERVEAYLIRHGKKKLKDPILVLGEAYSRSEDPQVRKTIAEAARRSVKGLGIRGNDDAEFVDRAMRWYQTHRDQLIVNPEYGSSVIRMTDHFKQPLFKWKSPSAAKPAWMETFPQFATPVRPSALGEQTNTIGMKFILIPPGEFVMGSPESEKGRQENEIAHPVRITKPFWLGVYEVTQTQYERLMGNHSSFSYSSNVHDGRITVDTRDFPVDSVPWNRAAEFCNRLSVEEGFPPYYKLITNEHGRVFQEQGGPGYRLPTEAEWEYACRAGTTTPFSFGQTFEEGQANFNRQQPGPIARSYATTVGSYPPNAFGLYDMHGNIAEWCNDVADSRYYEDCPIDDPHGPPWWDPEGKRFLARGVIRGGSGGSKAEQARSAYRALEFLSGDGFRVARSDGGEWQRKLQDLADRDSAPVTLAGHTAEVLSLAFRPDGKMLASGSRDGTIKLWDVASATISATLNGHAPVRSVAFSPDGRTLATGGDDRTVKLWDVATGENTSTLTGHTIGVHCVAYSPDGITLASGSPDETIRLWDVATLKQRTVLEGHTWTLCYSPDGTRLASAGWGRVKFPEINDRKIKLWDTQTGENVGILKEPPDSAYGSFSCLAYSPDGKTLALAGEAPLVRLWDVASGQIIAHLRQDLFQIHCVAYCPDGRRLVSAAGRGVFDQSRKDGDPSVRLWDLATGKSRILFRERPNGFRVVAISPDGKTLAAGSIDGPIRVSPLPTLDEGR